MAKKKAAKQPSVETRPIREAADAVGAAAEAFIVAVTSASTTLAGRVATLKASVGAVPQPTSEEYEAVHTAKQALLAALNTAKTAIEKAVRDL